MGPRMMRHLPKYVHGYVDRHGKPRFYFRRAGYKPVPLPGMPWSTQFMDAYEGAVKAAEGSAALSGFEVSRQTVLEAANRLDLCS